MFPGGQLSKVYAADVRTAPPVVVTATRLPEAEATISQSVVILDEAEIRQQAPVSLPDLLRSTATVYADRPGTSGGFASLYLRGADPSHTVILIDGVKVNDPTNARGGGIDLSLIDPRTIEHVEILPGASSALYGADAMAGVVNIVTGRAERTQWRIGGGIGGRGYERAFASGSIAGDAVTLNAEAAATNDGPASDASYSRLRTGSLRFRAGNGTDRRFDAWVRLQRQTAASYPEDSGGRLFAVRRQLEQRETDATVAALSGESNTIWGSLRLYSNLYDQESDTRSPGIAPGLRDPLGLPRSTSASSYRRWALGAAAVLGSGADAPALIGAQYEKERGDSRSMLFFGPSALPATFELERDTRSLFAEGRMKVTPRLAVHGGVRADDTDKYGLRETVQLGAKFRVGEETSALAVNYGTGFKPPSFFALGHPLVGNPELRPEESRTFEVSIGSDGPVGARRPLSYRVSAFHSRYEDLVDFDAGPPPRLVNRSDVTIRGYEVSAEHYVSEAVSVHGAVTRLTFDLPPGAPPLRSRPRVRATSAVVYSASSGFVAALYANWTSKVFDSSIPTGGVYLRPRLVLDATLAYQFSGAHFLLAIDNVLDKEYQPFVGFPGAGRRVRLEVAFPI